MSDIGVVLLLVVFTAFPIYVPFSWTKLDADVTRQRGMAPDHRHHAVWGFGISLLGIPWVLIGLVLLVMGGWAVRSYVLAVVLIALGSLFAAFPRKSKKERAAEVRTKERLDVYRQNYIKENSKYRGYSIGLSAPPPKGFVKLFHSAFDDEDVFNASLKICAQMRDARCLDVSITGEGDGLLCYSAQAFICKEVDFRSIGQRGNDVYDLDGLAEWADSINDAYVDGRIAEAFVDDSLSCPYGIPGDSVWIEDEPISRSSIKSVLFSQDGESDHEYYEFSDPDDGCIYLDIDAEGEGVLITLNVDGKEQQAPIESWEGIYDLVVSVQKPESK